MGMASSLVHCGFLVPTPVLYVAGFTIYLRCHGLQGNFIFVGFDLFASLF